MSGNFGQVPAIAKDTAVLREGISVITASRANQAAVELGGRGIFSELLCGALDGGGADVLGAVTVASVYAYVEQALGPWDQRPLLKSHVTRLVPLRTCKPAVSPETGSSRMRVGG